MRTVLPYASVLCTGAEGFVGQRLVRILRQSLPEQARLTLAAHHLPDGAGSEWLALDITDASSVRAAMESARPDLVVHLAAQSSVGATARAGPAAWAVNHLGSFNIAAAIGAVAPQACLFFPSSAEVYGRTFNREVATEASDLRPMSIYARTKAAAEAMLADVLPDTARLIVTRPSNHSGPGQDSRFVLPAFAEQIARIEAGLAPPVVRVGNLDAERDFLHLEDVLEAYLALLAAEKLPARATFNIASGTVVRIGDLLDRLVALSRVPVSIERDPARARPSDIARAALSADALRSTIGWAPSRDIDTIVADVLADQRARIPEA